METKANFLLLGSVAIAGIALILVFSAWLVGSNWRGGFHTFDIVFRGPVRGLSEGGEVRFNGIKIGEVVDLRIDEEDASRVVARVRVAASTPIKTDSEAQLEAVGLTGVTLIQLGAGSAEAEELEPRLGAPTPRLYASPGTIDELLTQENAERLSELLANLRTISAELAREDSVVAESARAARSLTAAAAAIEVAARRVSEDMGPALVRAEAAASSAEIAFSRFENAGALAAQDTLPRVAQAAEAIERLSVTSDRLVTRAYRDPTGFVQGRRPHTIEVAP